MWYKDSTKDYVYSRCNMSLGELRYFDFADLGIEDKRRNKQRTYRIIKNHFLMDKNNTFDDLKEWF